MANKIECSTCFYWTKKDNNEGDCRVNAPTPLLTPINSPILKEPKRIGVISFFPITRGDIWCGQYSHKAMVEVP